MLQQEMQGTSASTTIERRIRALAAQEQQPFYLYDVEAIRQMCRTFRALSYAPASVHFACMANPHPRFLSIVREEGLELFANSLLHLHAALELREPPRLDGVALGVEGAGALRGGRRHFRKVVFEEG